MKTSIAKRLADHLAGDGTPNDSETGDLYREAHGLNDGDDTDLESVEIWAWETVNNFHRPASA